MTLNVDFGHVAETIDRMNASITVAIDRPLSALAATTARINAAAAAVAADFDRMAGQIDEAVKLAGG